MVNNRLSPTQIILCIIVALSLLSHIVRNHNDTLLDPFRDARNSPFSFSDVEVTLINDGKIAITGNLSSTKVIFAANVRFTAFKDAGMQDVLYTDTYQIGMIPAGGEKPFSFIITSDIGPTFYDIYAATTLGLTRLTAYTDEMHFF